MADAWDGRPENPERDGWHEFAHNEEIPLVILAWEADVQRWLISGNEVTPTDFVARSAGQLRYLGPCITRAEVAAREAAAAEAMREAIKAHLKSASVEYDLTEEAAHTGRIRTTGWMFLPPLDEIPLPAPAAFARALAQAREEGMKAARSAAFHAVADAQRRGEGNLHCVALSAIHAAIRAQGKEVGE